MEIKDSLHDFIFELSKQHAPFKRENDNQKYQSKYVQIFNLIVDKLNYLEDSVQIHKSNFQKIYRNYKAVLKDLYEDSVIYFCTSKNGSLIHGNKGFSKKDKGNYSGTFSSFYKLNTELIIQIKTQTTFQLNKKKSNIKLINETINKKLIETDLESIDKQMNAAPKLFTENKWYEYLTDKEGKKIMEELPHYGQYTDGRIYSKFHSLKRDARKNLRLCGSKIMQVFDITHCFPTLIGVLIKGKIDDKKVNEYRKYIMENDIYIDALKETYLPITEENRNRIKPYFNKFILSTIKDNVRNQKWSDEDNDPELFKGVVNFFKNKFPEVYDFIWNYETADRIIKGKNGKLIKKKVKILAHHLQIIEKMIIDELCKLIKDIPYITLHDAIYVAEENLSHVADIDFEKEFRKIIDF